MESGKRKVLRILVPIAILGAGIAVSQGLIRFESEPPVEERAELERTVETRPLTFEAHRTRERFEGTVRPQHVAELRSRIQGTVSRVGAGFREGAAVDAGDLLVELDPFDAERDLEEARADLRAEEGSLAETRARLAGERAMLLTDRDLLSVAEAELQRQERLRERGTVSQAALDAARREALETRLRVEGREQQIEQAEAQIDRLEAGVERAEARLSRARRDREATEILAPEDGLLADPAVGRGSLVQANERLATIQQRDTPDVRFFVDDGALRQLAPEGSLHGGSLTLRVDAIPQEIPGRLARGDAVAEPGLGGRFLRAIPLEPLPEPVESGRRVSVEIVGPPLERTARVPEAAFHRDDRKSGVIYLVEDGRLTARSAQHVGRVGDDILLRVSAEEGAPLVVTRFPGMAEGLAVRVVDHEDREQRRLEAQR